MKRTNRQHYCFSIFFFSFTLICCNSARNVINSEITFSKQTLLQKLSREFFTEIIWNITKCENWIILLLKIFKSKLFRYDCKRCQLNKNIFSIINIFFHSSKYSSRCSSFRSIVFLSLFLMMTRFWQTSLIKSSGPLMGIVTKTENIKTDATKILRPTRQKILRPTVFLSVLISQKEGE